MAANRYNSVAISLHWLIAILLAGLVVVAKVMNSLGDDDPLRFTLIQWHKSFGILALLLVVLRILWRISYRSPALPGGMSRWEKWAAAATHIVLYVLMFAIPLSGWMMVSASPLNLKTELFGVLAWPHLPYLTALADKELWTERLLMSHHWLANGMLILVLMHIAAALRHKFVLKDNLLSRMVIAAEHRSRGDLNHGLVVGGLIAVAGVIYLADQSQEGITTENSPAKQALVLSSGVTFKASQLGDPLSGVFEEVTVELLLDAANLSSSSLTAKVTTASVNTGDGQIDGTVVTADWFASDQYPFAGFQSTSIAEDGDAGYRVVGDMSIRDVVKEVVFSMSVSDGLATGEFIIDRTQFNVGVGGQDEFVAPEVTISFQTPVVRP